MPAAYDPSVVEPKWQERWAKAGVYSVDLKAGPTFAKASHSALRATRDKSAGREKPFYSLVMFPYPSGDKLHVGHWYNFGPADSAARYVRMHGKDVFAPMGFDAFGLPAENYAVKTGIHPAESTRANVETMITQLKRIGCMYDWDTMVNTSEPAYYRWTQWLFLQMYAHGLAYKKEAPVNFCPSCKTVLANEQVHAGLCERCETEVIQKLLHQWFWKITDYAERLLDGLDGLDWPPKTKLMQRNWIGRSEGAEIRFAVDPSTGSGQDAPPWEHHEPPSITVFTTRPDTLFGAMYLVLAPEHPLVEQITPAAHWGAVAAYREEVKKKTELQRTDLAKVKSGVPLGAFALHPATGERMPIWIADYVLVTYGTGAIMAVPAHDERDFEFAKAFKLPIREVLSPCHPEPVEGRHVRAMVRQAHHDTPVQGAFTGEGIAINSEFLNGLPTPEAKKRMIAWLEDEEKGREIIQYRLRDWLVSRQRYWGAPIPIVYDTEGKPHPIPEKHLPWLLPTDVEFKPTGESPLKHSQEFKERTEKIFGKGWTPEYDTMDTFVCSSFYYLRFLASPESRVASHEESSKFKTPVQGPRAPQGLERQSSRLIDPEIEKRWMPVSLYIGGAEHATMHLIYARFVMMALKDFGFVSHEEPFKKLVHQGTITNRGAKMSKSRGNVVSPDAYIERYGSDVLRMFLMFMGPFTDGGDWSDTGIKGIDRFVQRVWKTFGEGTKGTDPTSLRELRGAGGTDPTSLRELRGAGGTDEVRALHRTIKRVTESMEKLHFNTAISSLMEFLNEIEQREAISRETAKTFALLLAPLAPHLAEELWEVLHSRVTLSLSKGDTGPGFVIEQPWPTYDRCLLVSDTLTIVVQVNGKLRGQVEVAADAEEQDIIAAAKAQPNVKKFLDGKPPKKEIYVQGKLVSFVV